MNAPRPRQTSSTASVRARAGRLALAACAAQLGVLGGAAVPIAFAQPVEYTMEYRPGEGDATLAVRIEATLDPSARDITLHLPDWGGWTEFDSLYIRGFRCDPPAHRDAASPGAWSLEIPEGWDGSLGASYTIPMIDLDSRAAERFGLLPLKVSREGAPPYAALSSRNTLALVAIAGEPVRDARVVLVPPPGYHAASGWAGLSPEPSTPAGPFTADPTEDSPILFGAAPRSAVRDTGGVACEVIQISAGPDATAPMLDLIADLSAAYARTTGLAPRNPIRVFVTDKGGGQRVDRGLWVQAPAAAEEASPYLTHLLAHELFHEWLGGMAHAADESTVWFSEGFTDYLSLWHLAATGHVTPEWFARRMGELNDAARASPAHGHAAFGDPAVGWRDWDGPNETLAYKGGAVLAFALDAELRRAGHPPLAAIVADLAALGEPYTLGSIRAWIVERGLASFYDAHIAAPALPDWPATLAAAGFRLEQRPADLAYLGLHTDDAAPLGPITAIDPDGPAAALGLAIGDRITGLWPSRTERPLVGPGAEETPFRFGLDLARVDAGPINLGVRSAAGERVVQLTPRPMPGGLFESPVPGPDAAAFLTLPDAPADR